MSRFVFLRKAGIIRLKLCLVSNHEIKGYMRKFYMDRCSVENKKGIVSKTIKNLDLYLLNCV